MTTKKDFERTKRMVHQVLSKLHPDDQRSVLNELTERVEDEMGEARKKRLMVKRAERRVEEVRQQRRDLDEKQEENWKELEKLREEFNNLSAEYQEKLWVLCDVAGPEFFPRDSQQIARLYLDAGLFDRPLGANVPEEIEHKIFTRLAFMLEEYLHDKTGRLSQGLAIIKEAAEKDGDKLSHEWNTEYVKALFGSIYAKRMIHEKSAKAAGHFVPFTKIDWKKHMLPSETVKYGKKTLEEFMHSHEEGLTGRALTAKRALDEVPTQGVKEIRASLEEDVEGDFAALKEAVEPIFSKEYPKIEPDKRTEAFMALFDMVANYMQEGWMKKGLTHDVDAVAYLAAESIFLEGYARLADKVEGWPAGLSGRPWEEKEDSPFDHFEKKMREQKSKLTGNALQAQKDYAALHDDEKTALEKVVWDMPKDLSRRFGEIVEERMTKHGVRMNDAVDFQMVFDACFENSELEKLTVEPHLKSAFSYLVTDKLLRDGFKEAVEHREEEESARAWSISFRALARLRPDPRRHDALGENVQGRWR